MKKLFYTVILIFSATSYLSSQYVWKITDSELMATELSIDAANVMINKLKSGTFSKLNSQIGLETKRNVELKQIKEMKENLLSWTKTVSDVFVGIKKVDEIYSNCTKIIDNYNSCQNLLQKSVNDKTISYQSFISFNSYIGGVNDEYREVKNLVRHLVVENLSSILTKREQKDLNMDEGNRLVILYRINDALTEVNSALIRTRYTLTAVNGLAYTSNYDYEDFIFFTVGASN